MTSFVPEFIINPVLRQARRLSAGFATPDACPASTSTSHREKPSSDDDGPFATDEDVSGPGERVVWSSGSHSSPPNSPRSGLLSSPLAQVSEALSDDSDGFLYDSSPPRLTPAAGTGGGEPIAIESPSRNLEQDIAASAPASFYSPTELPEDDGMRALRKRIIDVQIKDIASNEKARLMHGLLMEGYTLSQIGRRGSLPRRAETPPSPVIARQQATPGPLDPFRFWHTEPSAQKFALTEDDLRPTYVPVGNTPSDDEDDSAEGRLLGCEHYRRNVKLQCFTCQRWYTCRLCHNENEDHILPRAETRHMLCMLCGHAQRAGDMCAKCGTSAARYYCNTCKLWNDDPEKSIYHCNDCGICRVGEGLGKDFIHCKVLPSFQIGLPVALWPG